MTQARRTLVVGLSHPDDEVACAGTVAAQVARGDRVVLVWLTRGSMTEALGAIPASEVARLREAHGLGVADLLGCDARFLDFEDTWVEATAEAAHRVARVLAELRPDGLLTWGEQWRRGPRHPDHQATGKIFRDAITLARIAKVVAPLPPHRLPVPVFTFRGEHSTLPAVAVDVTPVVDTAREVAAFYRERMGGWPAPGWLEARLAECGRRWGVPAAEEFDAWEAPPGLYPALL